MADQQCVFCAIAKRQINSFIVYEDEDSVAFLDIMPRSRGMVVVVPKKHYVDFAEDVDMSAKIFLSAERVAQAVRQVLNPLTVFISVIPSQIPHFHVKVYPAYENEVPLMEAQPKKAEESELASIAQAVSAAMPSVPAQPRKEEAKVEEKPAEKKEEKKKGRTKEETYWIRRGLEIA